MKDIYRHVLSIVIFTIALFAGVLTASAQIIFKRSGGPVVAAQTQPQTQNDTWKPLPASAVGGSVTVTVNWNRTLGLPPAYAGSREAHRSPCGLIVVSVLNRSERRDRVKVSSVGTFTTEDVVGVRFSGFYYACTYKLEGLPKDQDLGVRVSFANTGTWDTTPWISNYTGFGEAAPSEGQTRIFAGPGELRLTDQEPTKFLRFSINYSTNSWN